MPMTQDPYTAFSLASLEDLEAMLQTPAGRRTLSRVLGRGTVQALRNERQAALPGRAAGSPPTSIVVLPGLMGSLLHSTRGVIDFLWINPAALLKGQANRLQLTPDGQGDADPDTWVTPTNVELVVYTQLMLAAKRAGRVLAFPYDWRKDVRLAAADLRQSIDHWRGAAPERKLTLVGHSLGGLVGLTYLALYPDHAWQSIERLVMVGTPLRGAVDAVLTLAYGNGLMELMGKLNARNDVLRLVRSFPSVYQVLPAPRELFPPQFNYPVSFDLYDARAWPVPGIPQHHLDTGYALHRLLAGVQPPVPVYQIAGCNLPTNIALNLQDGRLIPAVGSRGQDSGDGTVALWSAQLLAGPNYYASKVKHLKLPAEDSVMTAILALARGDNPDLPTTVPVVRSRSAAAPPTPPIDPDVEAERLRAAIEAGTLSLDDVQSLYFLP